MGKVTDARRFYADALQDLGGLLEQAGAGSNAVREDAIKTAVDRFSERIPTDAVQLYSTISTDGFYSLPTDFELGLSRIVSIEFPIDQNPPVYIAEKAWGIRHTESASKLYLNPNPSSSFRVRVTKRHTYDGGADTASWLDAHSALVGQWAAAIALNWFADRYGHSVESNNDGVNWRTKAQEARENAKMLLARVYEQLRPYELSRWLDLSPYRMSAQRRV
jgi:hypothetical protein